MNTSGFKTQWRPASTSADPVTAGVMGNVSKFPKCAGDVMTTSVVTVYPHTPFRDAVDLMAKHSLHHLVVVEMDGSLAGIISDRDVLAAASSYDSEATLVADVMTYAPVTVTPGTFLSQVVATILDHRFNCLPVVDDSMRVKGIVTTTGLLQLLQELQLMVETV